MRIPFLLFALLLLCAFPALADAPQYTITDIGNLPGYGNATAYALNDKSQIVGKSSGHAFLWENGHMTDIGDLLKPFYADAQDSISAALGINNVGATVGKFGSGEPIFMSGLDYTRGFLYRNHKMQSLESAGYKPADDSITDYGGGEELHSINDRGDFVGIEAYRAILGTHGKVINLRTLSTFPEGNFSAAAAINNQAQVVGRTTINKPTGRVHAFHAFLWIAHKSRGAMQDLGTLHSFDTSAATALNERGQVVGTASQSEAHYHPLQQAFLWSGGKLIGLGYLPGGKTSEAYGINNAGQIVGTADDRAFLWQHSKMLDLNTLIPPNSGWTLIEARAINNKGQIVGNGRLNGQPHAFLLTPVVAH